MQIKHFLFAAFIGLLFCTTACVKELPGILPQIESRLVLWGEIRAGEPVEIFVSQTFQIEGVEPDTPWISDAQVELWQDSTRLFDLVHMEQGRYRSPDGFLPQVGQTYRLEVSAPDLPSVSAETGIVPQLPLITQLMWEDSSLSPSRFNPQLSAGRMTFTIEDDSSFAYGLRMRPYLGGEIESQRIWFVGTTNSDLSDPNPCGRFLSNRLAMRLQVCPAWELGVMSSDSQDRMLVSFDSLVLEIFPVPVHAYEQLSQERLEDVERAFWEPASTLSNVKGGYGLVWATHTKKLVIEL